MKSFQIHASGRLMVMEDAGGTGGGVTSASARFATDDETTQYHAEEVRKAESVLERARDAHDRHVDRTRPPPDGSYGMPVGTHGPYEAVEKDGRWDVVDTNGVSVGYHEHDPNTEEDAREFAASMNKPPEPPPNIV